MPRRLISPFRGVALSVPGVQLTEGFIYTIFAMGLAGGEPALHVVPSVDAQPMMTLPQTGPDMTVGADSCRGRATREAVPK